MTIDKCHDRLYVGSRESLNRPMDLQEAGITAIVNVADNVDQPNEVKQKYKCAAVALTEHWIMGDASRLNRGDGRNPQFMIDMAIEVIKRLMDKGEVVMVHCLAGCHRSPSVIALYVTQYCNVPIQEQWRRMKSVRPGIRNYTESEFLPQ